MDSSYDRLGLRFDGIDSISKSLIEVYAFKNRQFLILHGEWDAQGQVQIRDFSDLSLGIWRLFVLIEEKLHPLQVNTINAEPFTSLRHQIKPINRSLSFYLEASPNALRPETIAIENIKEGRFRISISLSPADYDPEANYALLLDDPKSGRNSAYPFVVDKEGMRTELPMEDLFSTLFTKRFFILQQNNEPKVHQFLLDARQLASTEVRFKVIADSQYVKLRFYKRKDFSLGLKLSKPKLRKAIKDIDGLRINGQIGPTDEFIDSAAYLLVEERLSQDSVKVPVRDNFTVYLDDLDLIGLKSRDKMVFDFFIVIETESGDIVRKEKIKYQKASYKKILFTARQSSVMQKATSIISS